MSRPDPEPTRLEELLADAVLFGITPEERQELDRLLAENPDADPASLERLTADIARLLVPTEPSPLPADVTDRLLQAAAGLFPAGINEHAAPAVIAIIPDSTAIEPKSRSSGLLRIAALTGWATAAACLLTAVGIWQNFRAKTELTSVEKRERLLTSGNAIQIEWTATQDPTAKGASGDVVWSSSAQQGVMRFRGLEPNNPEHTQYQLWIFDQKRDERYPVDGGVFDIPPKGEVLIPFRPAVRVDSPVLFAITVEKPGGVVVSDRQRLPLLAKVSQ